MFKSTCGRRDTSEPESTAATKYAPKPLERDIKPLFMYKLQVWHVTKFVFL